MQTPMTLGQYASLLKENTDYMLTAVVAACILSDKLRVGRITRKGIYLQDDYYPKLDEIAATALFYYGACVKSHIESQAYSMTKALDQCVDMLAIAYLITECSEDGNTILNALNKTIEHYDRIEDYAYETRFDYIASILCAVMQKITGKRKNKLDGYDCGKKDHTGILQEFKQKAQAIITG